jgi:hypothetical protein
MPPTTGRRHGRHAAITMNITNRSAAGLVCGGIGSPGSTTTFSSPSVLPRKTHPGRSAQRGSRDRYGLPATDKAGLSLFGNASVGRGRHLGCVAIGCTAQDSAGKLRDWRGREQKTTERPRVLIVRIFAPLRGLNRLLSDREDGMLLGAQDGPRLSHNGLSAAPSFAPFPKSVLR